jgi:hypothetical protein
MHGKRKSSAPHGAELPSAAGGSKACRTPGKRSAQWVESLQALEFIPREFLAHAESVKPRTSLADSPLARNTAMDWDSLRFARRFPCSSSIRVWWK